MRIDRESLRTGIPIIDRQHEEYFGLVERFFAMSEHSNTEIGRLESEVDKVIAYAIEHFDAEEYLMQSANYPHYEEHCAKHNVFREKVDTIVCGQDRDALALYIAELSKWLIDWFSDQICNDDKKLAAFLKEQGEDKLLS
ncbi:MAG: hemerythrin domain-containing protein [Verrucomicrobia bacterium]|nr:hemerythrin domain-containing protein [Verrucomicrobiota bacterium]MCF7709053.1 hemerythrin domain-containing protein [Verrucomicrobiota bacterium]